MLTNKKLLDLMQKLNLNSLEEVEAEYKKINLNIGFFVSPLVEGVTNA